jgi:hypothetical protein
MKSITLRRIKSNLRVFYKISFRYIQLKSKIGNKYTNLFNKLYWFILFPGSIIKQFKLILIILDCLNIKIDISYCDKFILCADEPKGNNPFLNFIL